MDLENSFKRLAQSQQKYLYVVSIMCDEGYLLLKTLWAGVYMRNNINKF